MAAKLLFGLLVKALLSPLSYTNMKYINVLTY